MSGKQTTAPAAKSKATKTPGQAAKKKAKLATQLPGSGKNKRGPPASTPNPSSTTPDKRKRNTPPTDSPASNKKRKTKDARASSPATTTVVPVTPGRAFKVQGSQKHASHQERVPDAEKAPEAPVDAPPGGPTAQKTAQKAAKTSRQKATAVNKNKKPPATLPLDPHAALLADLRPRRDVLVLSVISSSRMEKRITAVLNHLAKKPVAGTQLPPVVLLHARADDVGKLLSIAEIAKRRIREGFYREDQSQEGDTNKEHAAVLAWYQYNRVYDVQVETARKETDAGKDWDKDRDKGKHKGDQEEEEDQEDDGFEPMPQRFREAIGDASARRTSTQTFMSALLSRVALPELLRHPDITCQASTDPIEMEYQSWMVRGL